jgi:hypothetical protein
VAVGLGSLPEQTRDESSSSYNNRDIQIWSQARQPASSVEAVGISPGTREILRLIPTRVTLFLLYWLLGNKMQGSRIDGSWGGVERKGKVEGG